MTQKFFIRCISRIVICFLILFLPIQSIAQSISGFVFNEDNEPIPFANIFFRELGTGTTTDIDGKYFFTTDEEREFEMIVSSVGYATKSTFIIIEGNVVKNIWLSSSNTELDEIVIKASKKDPAYEIIQKVIDNKKKYLSQIKTFRSKVYIKAIETTERKEKKKKKQKEEMPQGHVNGQGEDVFDKEEKKEKGKIPQLNMVETELMLNYQFPKSYKEERTAYKSYGSRSGLFIPRFDETDFNFYNNLVKLKGIAEVPVISPISRTAILSYKYKLISTTIENGRIVHKIKVIPRKSGNATCKGYIYINEGIWNINRLDLTFNKDGLMLFDGFQLKQRYQQLEKNIWIPDRIEFIYESKQNKHLKYKGNTTILYSDFQKDFAFPPKFFGREIAVTTKEAYKRDSVYWNSIRPEPLTKNQQIIVARVDSVRAVRNSKEYKDSIQAKYNKVTLMDLVWDGVGFRNHEKKRSIYTSSIPSLINFEVIGGLRIGPYLSYFKRFENRRSIGISGDFNVGIKNKDLQGNIGMWTFYNPHKLASARINVGRSFYSINSFDAYLNQLKASNYILHDQLYLGHSRELVNGLYFGTFASFSDRQSIAGYETTTVVDSLIPDDSSPLDFENYQALITSFELSYTPFQKYMTEPTHKVVLGSSFPTFTLTYKKGWNKLFGSDIDFDYVDFTISQDLILGYFGNSKYNIRIGKYLNTKKLEIVDLKRFRQSDPILYSDPLNAFQSLDTAFATTKFFFEAHHIHHFNGALINNIPLVKKTKVRVVAGGGILWVKENNFHHQEFFAGLERVFRLGARRKLRVGLYGIVANSSFEKPKTDFKVSFDIIDTWKRNWDF